ncbi:diacylglycerol kinase family protein [Patescibacteria group bacterium]|nr:diacylglycerol kinase family protein [Patescibacteria group bacterium]MCL5091771.1 diacylglycerol kinase family protein [Patescibacteria group bacterium]
MKQHHISFKNAWRGLRWALASQPNYKIHLSLSVISLLAGWMLRISAAEFLTIITLIVVGLTIETVNTAIEETNDAIDTRWRADIGMAKDVAAGAMLMFAVGATVIAGVIFIPKILMAVAI